MNDLTRNAYEEFVRSTTNHTPSAGTIDKIEAFRGDVQEVAEVLIANVPPSRARSVALTHLEDAVMWGVKALILAEADVPGPGSAYNGGPR